MRPSGPTPRVLAGAALILTGGCTLAGPATEHGGARPGDRGGRKSVVRVGVKVDAPLIRLESEGLLRLIDEQGRVLSRGTGPWVVEGTEGRLTTHTAGGDVISARVLVARSDRGVVEVDGVRYRGSVLLRGTASGVTAVNRVDLETYLRGVVPLELGRGRSRSDQSYREILSAYYPGSGLVRLYR